MRTVVSFLVSNIHHGWCKNQEKLTQLPGRVAVHVVHDDHMLDLVLGLFDQAEFAGIFGDEMVGSWTCRRWCDPDRSIQALYFGCLN